MYFFTWADNKVKKLLTSVNGFQYPNGLEIVVHKGLAVITFLPCSGRTTLALHSTPQLHILRITPPVFLLFLQFASIIYDYSALCHIFDHLDGKTTSPSTSKRPNGKKLVGCQKLPAVNFLNIDCQIPLTHINMLRKDQQNLLDISKAINSGTFKKELEILNCLRKANRILKLYISEESHSPKLHKLVLVILKSYMPMCFTIKTSKHSTVSLKLVYKTIQSTRYLSKPLLDVVDPVFELSGFTVSHDSRWQEKHKRFRKSEGKVDIFSSRPGTLRKITSVRKNTQKLSTGCTVDYLLPILGRNQWRRDEITHR